MMSWDASAAIRARRATVGITQSELAKRVGISKSLLSHIESGRRQATWDQITNLAAVLGMPSDLLAMGLGRLPSDVAQALEQSPADCVTAVRSQVEAKPVSYPTAPRVIPTAKRPRSRSIKKAVLPERIHAAKTSTSYRAHSYHTKVPPEAITPFIRAFTEPGDVVFDPFCGSGMTGVAALMEGRNALLSDLSPAAVHIASNYTSLCDPTELAAALQRVEAAVQPTIEWLYRPVSGALVEYTTWSDMFQCPSCQTPILYWNAVQAGATDERDGVSCPSCGTVTKKAGLKWIGEQAVVTHTSGGKRIHPHEPTREELALIDEVASAPIPYWTPSIPFGRDREMWRAGHTSMGVHQVSDFYTKRNLHALAALRHAITLQSEGRAREALMFAFTAAVNRASKRYQWNAKRPTNVMTGTLYISSLRYEWNVWSLFKRKAADVIRYYKAFPAADATVEVFQHSASALDCLSDRSVDLVFMDPPFGSNIFYADSSLLWDAWLGELTDPLHEIVINKHRKPAAGGKNLDTYSELMALSFAETARVLKSGGRAVLAFSNSDDQVWQGIQRAVDRAGFETETAHVLNKGQASIKGVKGRSGQENVTTLDLIMCLKHKKVIGQAGVSFMPPPPFVDNAIRGHFASESKAQLLDQIYSAVIRDAIAANYSVAGITMPVIADRCRALGFVEDKGKWAAPSTVQESAPVDFVSGYLTERADLPSSGSKANASKTLGSLRVVGGRGSPFYLAHSYHTKVPPEAITPFIEHYTKPGDVILDPFCGSGMTGVAATLAGRRSILSDLSPAAVHLAWNHTRPCDPAQLEAAFEALRSRVGPEIDELYTTTHSDRSHAVVNWTLWSTKHKCPGCRSEFLLWDAVDQASGRIGRNIECPNCKVEIRRADLKSLGSVPAWVSYTSAEGKRFAKSADANDVRRAKSITRESIEAWFPTTAVGADREMFIRCALQLQGINAVADFYTPRNLRALSLIWREIQAFPDERLKRLLAFAFTNTAWHGTRMRRFNARGGQRPLTGTLYIPQLSIEANVLEVMAHKIAQLKRYFQTYQVAGSDLPAILLGSATKLDSVADASVDYVFTDPPFGSNIFYADCNLIWESWLGRLTDVTQEAVVNRSLALENGGKALQNYSDLMTDSMKEIARVLKPGGWATVVFHNTDADVWKAIRDAASAAGFEFEEASSLDRKQQSHKGYKGRSGVEDVAHFDVVFNLRRPPLGAKLKTAANSPPPSVERLVMQIAREPEFAARGLQGIHAEVMRRLASKGSAEFPDYAVVRKIYGKHLKAEAAE